MIAALLAPALPLGAAPAAAAAIGNAATWGANGDGRLGDGSLLARSVPTTLSLDSVAVVAAGRAHTAYLLDDGRVFVSGDNSNGQLGDGAASGQATSPVEVAGLPPVKQIDAGNDFTVALGHDSVLYRWGNLTGAATSLWSKPDVELVDVDDVAAGGRHILASKLGELFTWGADDRGQLGNGRLGPTDTPTAISVTNPSGLAAGGDTSFASDWAWFGEFGSTTSYAWGANDVGQLGIGAAPDQTSPYATDWSASAIAAGGEHTLLLDGGTVRATGRNDFGQLGDGTTLNRSTPVTVIGLESIDAISAGARHSLAIDADAQGWSWGDGADGRLGTGLPGARVSAVAVTDLIGVHALDAGRDHSAAVVGPTISFSVTAHDFGEVEAGSFSETLGITVTNEGPGDADALFFAGRDEGGTGFDHSDDCPERFPAGATCTLRITFAPTGSGAYSATIVESSSRVAGTHGVEVTGVGVGPDAPTGAIAFAETTSTATDLALISPAGVGRTPITTGPEIERAPAWDPRATRLAFSSNDSGPRGIYAAKADGSGRTAIAVTTDLESADPDVSPSGVVAYTRNNTSIRTVDPAVAGSDVELTTGAFADGDPSWSPDGRTIAFRRDGDIWVMNADGSVPQLVATVKAPASDPDWSPDGTLLAFSAVADGDSDIYTVPAAGGTIVKLTNNTSDDQHPAWSPTGGHLVFSNTVAGDPRDLWVMRSDGSELTALTTTPTVSEDEPTWVDHLRLSAAESTTASPAAAPVDALAVQPGATEDGVDVETATAIGGIKLGPSAIGGIKLGPTAIGGIKLGPTAIGGIKLGPSAIGGIKLGPTAQAALDRIPLSQLPLRTSPSWPERLMGTRFEGSALNHVSFGAVMRLDPLPASIADLRLADLDLSMSNVLASISPMAFALGGTPVEAIGGIDWCAFFVNHGYPDCGAALSAEGEARRGLRASLLELELIGLPVHGLAINAVPLGRIALDAGPAPVRDIPLGNADVGKGPFAAIETVNLPDPDAVVDCAVAPCSTPGYTLAQAQDDGTLRAAATIPLLGSTATGVTLGETAFWLLPVEASPVGRTSLEDLGAPDYSGSGSHTTSIYLEYTAVAYEDGVELEANLPESFRYAGGAESTVNGLAHRALVTEYADSRNPRWTFSGIGLQAGETLQVQVPVRPGIVLGTFTSGATAYSITFGSIAVERRAPITILQNHESNGFETALPRPPLLSSNTLAIGHITPGDTDTFRVSLPKGTRFRVQLDHMANDDDLVVYGPGGTATGEQPLRAVHDALPGFAPETEDSVEASTVGEPLTVGVQDDVPIRRDLPLIGVSNNRSTAAEVVQGIATYDSGEYLVQVSGFNGSSSDRPYSLLLETVAAEPEAVCPERVFEFPMTAAGDAPTMIDRAAETIFLAAPGRLSAAYGSARSNAVLEELYALAGDPTVNGQIVNVDSTRPVAEAYAAWDASPCSVAMSNNVVRAINDLVDTLLDHDGDGRPDFFPRHIVMVGSHEIVPHGLITDLTQTGNERGFSPELAAPETNSLRAAFAAGYVPTDDPYGDDRPTPMLGSWLHVTKAGLGRLVETPEEISTTIARFRNAGSSLDPSTARALVTGYDFMDDAATAIHEITAANAGRGSELLDRAAGWNADSLRAAWSQQDPAPEIASVNGHFNPVLMDPASDSAGPFTTADLATGASSPSRIAFTIGCHSATSQTDLFMGAVQDWPQATAANGTLWTGQTGYGLGVDHVVAYSEQLAVLYAQKLFEGLTAGEALAHAKDAYLKANGTPGIYDVKVMAQAVTFGLPMLSINGAPREAPAPVETSVDPATGLEVAADVAVDPQFSPPRDLGSDGSVLDVAGGDHQVSHDQPVQPRLQVPIAPAASGTPLLGVLMTELTSFDEQNVDPFFARPVTDAAAAEEGERQIDGAIFPASPIRLNRSELDEGSQLVFIAGQHRGTGVRADGTAVGDRRRHTHAAFRPIYGNTGDDTPAVFSRVDGVLVDGSLQVAVDVTDPQSGHANQVLVLARDERPSGEWRQLWLTRSGDRWIGGLPVMGERVEFVVQAVGAGGVAFSTNKGASYIATPPPPATGRVLAVVAGVSAPGGAQWFSDASVSFRAHDGAPLPTGVTVDASVNGGLHQRVGGSLSFTAEGIHRVEWRASDGSTGTTIVALDTGAPSVAISSPVDGSTIVRRTAITVDYACGDTGAGIASCTGTLADGEPLDTITLGTRSFTVTTTDLAGRATTSSVTYTVVKPDDTTAPIIALLRLPSANAAGWSNEPVSLDWTVSDPETPILSSSGCSDGVVSNETSGTTYTCVATNDADLTSSLSEDVRLDRTAPTLTATVSSPSLIRSGWYAGDVTVTFSCADGLSGIVGGTCPAPVTLTANAADQLVNGSVTDVADNTTSLTVAGINIDKVHPDLTVTRTPANANGWNATDVTVTFTCVDVLSGIETCTAPVTLSMEGANQTAPTGTAQDLAGNYRSSTVGGINIDKTAPAIGTARDVQPNANGWNNTSVIVSFDCSDALSGLDGSCPNAVTQSTEGAQQVVSGSVNDLAGNTGTASTSVSIDKTLPLVSSAQTPVANGYGWNNTDVTVSFACSDSLSGIGPGGGCSVPSLLTAESSGSSVTGTATDLAGNAVSTTRTVKIDKTSPSITATRSVLPNQAGWNRTDVTISFTCDDALSGIAAGACPAPVTLSAGADQSVTRSVVDRAGNEASVTVTPINIDLLAPTIEGAPTTAANAHGWYSTDVTVAFSCDDDLSGIASCPSPVTLTDSAADQLVNATAVDVADNVSSITVSGIDIDKVAPAITATRSPLPNADGWTNTGVTVTFSCSDVLSGIASCPAPVILGDGANQTVSGTATDNAGNTATITMTGINVDTVRPTIAGSRSVPANSAGWNNGTVTVSWSCADALSGVKSCTPPTTYTEETTTSGATPTGAVGDRAGNTATGTVGAVKIDLTRPLASITTADGAIVEATVLRHTVNGAAGDALAGVGATVRVAFANVLGDTTTVNATISCSSAARTSCTWTARPPAIGVYDVTAWSYDQAGNQSLVTPKRRITVV